MELETSRTISRRRLAAGAAWAVPAITFAGAAPALAASACPAGTCYLLDWDSATGGFTTHTPSGSPTVDWTRRGTMAATNCVGGSATATVSQQRTGGQYHPFGVGNPTNVSRTDTYGDFSISNQYSSGMGVGAGTAEVGLTLAQATVGGSGGTINNVTHENVTFTFSVPVKTVTFRIFDLTRHGSVNPFTATSNYIDAVAFDKPATVTARGDTGAGSALRTSLDSTASASKTTTTGSLTNYFYRSGDFRSGSGNRNVDVSLQVNGTSFTMAYDGISRYSGQTNYPSNAEWITIGDLTVCT